MPINCQSRLRFGSLISAGLSLVVLVILFVSWLDLTEAVRPPSKPKIKPAHQREIKPTPPRYVTLPPPPKFETVMAVEPKQAQLKMKISKPMVALKPTRKPAPNLTEIKTSINTTNTTPLKPQKSQKPLSKKTVPNLKNNGADLATKKVVEKGRILLRLLEHGTGPSIEFAWPDDKNARSRLYYLLVQCHGMRVALLDRKDRLFVRESRPGVKWQINLDRYSTFMRQILGVAADQEMQEIAQIKRQQSGLSSTIPMRIFTRQMDALVLGGISHIIGSDYRSLKSIHARYDLNGSDIRVTDIVADGMPYPGHINIVCPKELML